MARLFTPYGTEKVLTITVNQNFVVPPGVTKVNISGSGARGVDGNQYYVQRYRQDQYDEFYARPGYLNNSVLTVTRFGDGAVPTNYCTAFTETPNDPIYEGYRICLYHSDASYLAGTPTSTGATATAFGKSFPGSYGNTAPQVLTFTDVAVTPGTTYPIAPNGGSITITYIE